MRKMCHLLSCGSVLAGLAACSANGSGAPAVVTTSGPASLLGPISSPAPSPTPTPPPVPSAPPQGAVFVWSASFDAPATDVNGARLTGTEIVEIKAFDGRLFAGNSYWNETTEPRRGQVFRLDEPTGRWALDLQMPARYSRVSALDTALIERDRDGRAIAPRSLLLAGATYDYGNLPGPVGVFVREGPGRWTRTDLGHTANGIGYSEIRSIGAYRDSLTGADLVFLGASPAPHGIYAGGIDPTTGLLRFDTRPELEAIGADRFLSFAACDGGLYAGAKRRIYRRNDGAAPARRWELVLDLTDPAASAPLRGILEDSYWTPADDIRGMVCQTDRATGARYLMFGALNQIVRADIRGDTLVPRRELDIEEFLEDQLGYDVRYVQTAEHQLIAAVGNSGISFIGFEVQYEEDFLRQQPATPHFPTSGFSTDGYYLERRDDNGVVSYALRSIDRAPNEALARVRSFEPTPFATDTPGALYVGGYAPWFTPSTNTAWIRRGVPIDYSALFPNATVERTQDWRGSGQAALVVTPNGWQASNATVIFSHGAGSSPENYVCWPQLYADRNIRTILPYTPGAISPQTRASRFTVLQRIHRVAVQQQGSNRIVFGGHSFGAYATLLAAGADGRVTGVDPGNCSGTSCSPLAAAGYLVISGQPAQSAEATAPFWFPRSGFGALQGGRYVIYGSRDFSSTDPCLSAARNNPLCRSDSYTVDQASATALGNRLRLVDGFDHGAFGCGAGWRSRSDAAQLESLIIDTASFVRGRTGG